MTSRKKYKKELKKKKEKYKIQRAEQGFSQEDVWNMYDWFIHTVKPMLQHLRNNHVGSPAFLNEQHTDENGTPVFEGCDEKWNEILDRMIFLLGEMDEESCSVKNRYEEEWENAYQEFEEKYGLFGEKLLTEEEQKASSRRAYLPGDLPEYKEISEKHMNEEIEIGKYRVKCKNEFFELFSEYFYDLWD